MHLIWLAALSAASAIAQEGTPTDKWIQLFNGSDLEGWVPKITGYALNDNFGGTFRVEDGILKIGYEKYGDFGSRFGHLFYKHPYSHYRLAVEYRFVGTQAPGGPDWADRTSAIIIHGQAPNSMQKEQDFPISLEVQLAGGLTAEERHTANVCTPGTHIMMHGKLVTQQCTDSTSRTYRGEDWIRVEIEVQGSDRITHYVEGRKVLSYEKPQIGGRGVSNFDPTIKKDGTPLGEGYLAIQSASAPIEIRKIELLVRPENHEPASE